MTKKGSINMFINRLILVFVVPGYICFAQNIDDLKNIQNRIPINIKNSAGSFEQNNNIQTDFEDQQYSIEPYSLTESQSKKDSILSEYFGYNYFTLRDSMIFSRNLPPNKEYIIGSGDELIISMWGETQFRQSYLIDSEGAIFDEKIGKVYISGKNLEQIKIYLSKSFGKVYSTLTGREPTTFIDISLGKLKLINVNFVGHVNYPGIHSLHPFSNVLTGLIHAGGVDTTGTLRQIELIRDGKPHKTIDVYEFLSRGKILQNIQLKDNDVISIPLRKSWVKITNQVNKPGIYESINNESINDLIEYASGLSNRSSSKIVLTRTKKIENRSYQSKNYQNYYLSYDDLKNTKVQNGDIIDALKVLDETNKVEIIGRVKKPGVYKFYEGMKLADLLDISGGLDDTTFYKSVYPKSAQIIRRNPKTRYENIISVNLDSYLKERKKEIFLQNLDRFVVHANLNFFERENIIIVGEVNIPGSYPVVSNNETLESIIRRSGGFTKKAHEEGVSIFRKNTSDNYIAKNIFAEQSRSRVSWRNNQILVFPGDSIHVKELTNTVTIKGEVYNQGKVEYVRGKPLSYYINQSGGLTPNGNKRGIVIIYANGTVSPKKRFNSPQIKDGSTIVVHEKENQQPFDVTSFASSWATIVSSIVTTIILTRQIN